MRDETTEKIIKRVLQILAESRETWDTAVHTAGFEEREEAFQDLWDAAEDEYSAAIEAIRGGDLDRACRHLAQAEHLESEGGDSSYARSAIKFLVAEQE